MRKSVITTRLGPVLDRVDGRLEEELLMKIRDMGGKRGFHRSARASGRGRVA
jgi:hypothetical protein